jgi:hypothetical protein
MAITARARKEIRNGLESPRKSFRIQETKKSYTLEHPVSMQPDSTEPALLVDRRELSVTSGYSRATQKNGGLNYLWKPPCQLEFFAALFLHHGSTLKEMDDDRNHRE